MLSSRPNYTRLLVIVNSAKKGTRAYRRAEQQIAYLANTIGLDIERLETPVDTAQTISQIITAAKPSDLVVAEGGDGSMNTVAVALMQISEHERPDVIQAPAGTANDTFRSFNGAIRGKRMLVQVLRSSRIVIRPLRITIRTPDGKTNERLAMSYVGFNYTATTAKLINEPAHRLGKLRRIPLIGALLQDVSTWLRSLEYISAFNSHEEGDAEARQIVDRIIMHSRVIAKYGRPRAKHTDDDFEDYITTRETRTGVAFAVLRVMFGKSNGQKRKAITFTIGEKPVLVHTDCETFTLAPNAMVTVALHPESLTTYSVLAAQQKT